MDDFIMKLSQLVGGNLWLAPLIALLAGLLTSLTPCSLSTIPLILGCVGGLNEHEPKKAFRLSLTFAFGSMLTFTALGFAASLLGNLLNGLGVWLHLGLALLLIAMALQMFGRTRAIVQRSWRGCLRALSRRTAQRPCLLPCLQSLPTESACFTACCCS